MAGLLVTAGATWYLAAQMQTIITKDMALGALASIPRSRGGNAILWQSDVHACAKIVAYLLASKSAPNAEAGNFANETKASLQAVNYLVHGRNPSSTGVWLPLRDILTAMGAMWVRTNKEKARDKLASAAKSPMPPKVAVTVAPLPDVAPVAVKPIDLAVTSKGDVIEAKPPSAITKPSAMVGKPGQSFATVATGTRCNWRIDPENDDILVTTTKRLVCGSPEYRQKIREVALQLGAPRT